MKEEKLYLAHNGKEVHLGDLVKNTTTTGGITVSTTFTLDKELLTILKEAGVIVTTPPKDAVPTVSRAIERIAARVNWKPKKAESYINGAADMMPMAAFSIVLREIARMLDMKYPDHISKSEKIYYISSFDGRIHQARKDNIKSYKNFAAFRTLEDAKMAFNILKEPIKEMFGGDE